MSRIILAVALSLSSALGLADPMPFQTKESVDFVGVKQIAFTKPFLGVILRKNSPNPDEKQIDVYEFGEASKLNKAVCEKVVTKVFGRSEKIIAKMGTPGIKESATAGPLCQVSVKDDSPGIELPEKHFFARKFGNKVYGFVFNYGKAQKSKQAKSELKFIESLN